MQDIIKILHVTGSMNRGGTEVMIMDLLKNRSIGIHFDFLVHFNAKKGISKGDFDDEILKEGSGIYYTPTLLNSGIYGYVKGLKKIFKNINPDVVHIHLNSRSGIIALAAKLAGVKSVITHSHANIKFRGSRLYTFIANREFWFQKILINKYSTHFWGCSLAACNSLFAKDKSNQFQIINNAVDVENYQDITINQVTDFKRLNSIPDDVIVLGNIGRIVSHKNILFAIEVLNALVKSDNKYFFIYAGREDDSQYHNEIKNKVKEYKLDKHVVYLGLRDDIPLLMNAIDVFIAPALQEGFGLVAVEAQAAATPCVLYKGFPTAVDMQLGLTTFIEDFKIQNWVDAVLNIRDVKTFDKNSIKNRIEALGFDSRMNAKRVCDLYFKINLHNYEQ